jgi:hypothetical protein
VGELLAAFDAVRATHEAMDPDAFNDDGTYKGGINTVRHATCKGDIAQVCRRFLMAPARGRVLVAWGAELVLATWVSGDGGRCWT